MPTRCGGGGPTARPPRTSARWQRQWLYVSLYNASIHTNPFIFGALALDDAFTDREDELRELAADMRNGQDVLVYAPRRLGKSSLVLRASRRVAREKVLVGYCDLMRTPTKERFAAALARTIYRDIDSPVGQALDRAADLFRGLRVTPTMEVDPRDGSLRFTFQPGRKAAIDDTIESLLALPGRIASERKRRVVLVFDEFQETLTLDARFSNLMRAVFQEQPEVGHIYLGSKRELLERIFSDRNEPFWRSAKQLEIGPIAPVKFARYLRKRFDDTDRGIRDEALERLLQATGGHPYATQELAYFVWELVPTGQFAHLADVEAALEQVLRSEHNHFARLWDDAPHSQRLLLLSLADEPSRSIYSEAYNERHDLPSRPTLQTALAGLTRKELAGRNGDGDYAIVEPFLADWLRHEQTAYAPERARRRRRTDERPSA